MEKDGVSEKKRRRMRHRERMQKSARKIHRV